MFSNNVKTTLFVFGALIVFTFLFRGAAHSTLGIVKKSFDDLLGVQKEYLALEIPTRPVRDREGLQRDLISNGVNINESAVDPAIAELEKTPELSRSEPEDKVAVPEEPTPPPPHILISEIFYDAEGSDAGKEYIKLYNAEVFDIDLDGWRLILNGGSLLTIGSKQNDHTEIKSGEYFLIGLNNYSGNPAGDVVRSASLPNSTSTITLFDSTKKTADEIVYGGVLSGESWRRD